LTVVHRRDALRAAALLQERVKAEAKIHLKLGAVPVEICGKGRVEGIRIKDVKTGNEEMRACAGVFIFIGFLPDTGFLKGLVALNEDGFIKTDDYLKSSCAGIFASGDCRLRPFNQVVTACSEGAIAAFSATKFLECPI